MGGMSNAAPLNTRFTSPTQSWKGAIGCFCPNDIYRTKRIWHQTRGLCDESPGQLYETQKLPLSELGRISLAINILCGGELLGTQLWRPRRLGGKGLGNDAGHH